MFTLFKNFFSKYQKRGDKILFYSGQKIPKNQKFDKIFIANFIGTSDDYQPNFLLFRKLIKEGGALILVSINPFWGKLFGYKNPKTPLLYLWFIENLLEISGFKVKSTGYFTLPTTIPLISPLVNSIFPKLPKFKRLLPFQFAVALPKKQPAIKKYSVSVVIPMHNEEGNVADCIKQTPKMGKSTEIIIVDDGSTDNTLRIARSYQKKFKQSLPLRGKNLKVFSHKPNKGKVWAVKKGFDESSGDILMIWDADRTVPGNELPRFYELLASGQAEYSQGTRLSYPMEKQAMKFANLLGNLFFGWVYSWILGTRITDTLCGTKVLFKKDYKKIRFGTEPWGDFDLMFGAKKLGLKMIEVPVHYKARISGLSKMKTFKYGMVVAKMSLKGIWEFKIKNLFKNNFFLFIIFGLAFTVRFIGLIPNLPYHPDEGYIQKASHELFLNIVTRGDFEPHAYKYGSIVLYIQAFIYIPFLISAYFLKLLSLISLTNAFNNQTFINVFEQLIYDFRESLFWAQRASTAFFGFLSVVLVYFISKKLFSEKNSNTGKFIGLIAALIFSVTPSHVRSSHWVTTDILSLFTILLALYCMINIFKKSSLKWYIFSGLSIGIASSIRYFPVAILVYPIAVLFDYKKGRYYFLKVLFGAIFIPLGFVLSVPFLLFSNKSQEIFQMEMTQHVLPFYGTAVSAYVSALGSFVLSFGKAPLPEIATLVPAKFMPFYSSYLTFSGFGVIPTIASIAGALIALIKYPKQFLLLFIIPFVTWFYISFYMHASYDRLIIPILPFLSIFIGVLVITFWDFFKSKTPKLISLIIILTMITSILFYPFKESFKSSIDCSRPTVFKEAELWIDKNIPVDANVAHIPIFMFPSKPYTHLLETQPNGIFFPQELRNNGFEYIFINDSRFGYNLYPFYTDFFVRPEEIFQNTYILLALKNYETQTEEKMVVSRAKFCDPTKLLIYRVPQITAVPKIPIRNFEFDTDAEISDWHLQKLYPKNIASITYVKNDGVKNKGALQFRWDNVSYTGPRVHSEKIPILPNRTYFLTGWVKSSNDLLEIERDGFLRLDFLSESQDIELPGESLALSERIHGKSEWKKLTVIGKSGNNSKTAIISFQFSGSKNSGFFIIDDLELRGE